MSARVAIAIAAAIVLGGALLLYRATRTGGDSADAPGPTTTGPAQPARTAGAIDAGVATSSRAARPRPSLPSDLGAFEAESDTTPRIWTTGPTPEGEQPTPADTASTMRRLNQARDAYKNEDWIRALAVAESVLTVMPTRESAREIAAMSACRLHDTERAQDHADHLKRHRFKRARNVCLDEDIHLLDPYANDPIDAGLW